MTGEPLRLGRTEREALGGRISVCLLTYNHVHVVESTIASILEQSVDTYELIVSDDHSTDGTWERVLELACSDRRIRPVRTPRNLGMAGNANFAVALSSRPYIALLHHDDIYRSDLLERWGQVLDRHSDVAFVFNQYRSGDAISSEEFPAGRIDGHELLEKSLLARWGCAVRGTAMIRRSAWELVGGMREEFGLLADIDLWMRLCMIRAAGYVAEPLIEVRSVRPSYYPEMYQGGTWSWARQRCLVAIHSANREAYFTGAKAQRWIDRTRFSSRVSAATAKWLTYGLLKRKWNMLATSEESATAYDQWWVRAYRLVVRWVGRRVATTVR